MRQNESTPPTTAASMIPEAIIRAAEAKVFAPEEHAVEMAAHGPASPSRARVYSATENVLCVRR